MNMRARKIAWLLPLLLSACAGPKNTQPTPDRLLAPLVASLPRPQPLQPDMPASATIIPEQSLDIDANLEQEDLPPPRHRKLPKTVQQAVIPPPAPEESSGVSAIGTLSSGEVSDVRRETQDWIVATERGLNGMNRHLNDQEEKTAAQIREYLKQAREALNSSDVDGAHTLAEKARVLFGELNSN